MKGADLLHTSSRDWQLTLPTAVVRGCSTDAVLKAVQPMLLKGVQFGGSCTKGCSANVVQGSSADVVLGCSADAVQGCSADVAEECSADVVRGGSTDVI